MGGSVGTAVCSGAAGGSVAASTGAVVGSAVGTSLVTAASGVATSSVPQAARIKDNKTIKIKILLFITFLPFKNILLVTASDRTTHR
jgi:hypothetical protein